MGTGTRGTDIWREIVTHPLDQSQSFNVGPSLGPSDGFTLISSVRNRPKRREMQSLPRHRMGLSPQVVLPNRTMMRPHASGRFPRPIKVVCVCVCVHSRSCVWAQCVCTLTACVTPWPPRIDWLAGRMGKTSEAYYRKKNKKKSDRHLWRVAPFWLHAPTVPAVRARDKHFFSLSLPPYPREPITSPRAWQPRACCGPRPVSNGAHSLGDKSPCLVSCATRIQTEDAARTTCRCGRPILCRTEH